MRIIVSKTQARALHEMPQLYNPLLSQQADINM